MNIESFTDEVFKKIDEKFADEANRLLNSARNMEKDTSMVAGRMDGLTAAVSIIKETYKLFVIEQKDPEEDAKPLY